MGQRRQARERALQLLFQYDMVEHGGADARGPGVTPGPSDTASINRIESPVSMDVSDDTKPFVDQLVTGVIDHLPELDGLLQRFTEHWTVERMAVVDRNILRCAVYELLYMDQIPAKVTINEAIEIAKRYGSDESGAFVNGILDRIIKAEERLQSKRLATA